MEDIYGTHISPYDIHGRAHDGMQCFLQILLRAKAWGTDVAVSRRQYG